MSDHAHGAAHDHEYHSHGKLYFSIFLALCALTLISIAADLIHIPNRALLVGIVFAVAVSKALCVLLIFMHLKFERAWKYMLLAPTLILASTIPFALTPDIGTHYYVQTAPQIREFEQQEAAKVAGGDSHGHVDNHASEHKTDGGKQH